jgi:F-type H+-transporting ATPase subunit b
MQYLFAQIATLAAAAEGAEEPEGIDLVIPAIEELVAGIIAFAIVFVVFWRWGVPAIKRALDARQQAITGQLTEAEEAKTEAEELLADYRKQLSEARTEAGKIVDEARASAETVRTEIVTRAETEAEEITRRAREDAAAEKQRAAEEIKDKVAALSVELTEKVVAGAIDADAQQALVAGYLDDLDDLEAGE